MRKRMQLTVVLIVALLAMGALVAGCQKTEQPSELGGYNTAIYTEQGGGKLVVGSGGEVEIQSGATLDVQAGATTDFSSGIDLDGALLDLDADGDTSLTADTDDKIDVEIGGADVMTLQDWGATTIAVTTTKHLFEIADGAPIMSAGTNILAALNIDLAIGNSTAGTNSVYGILIDAISGDAENTETAISVGTGWDIAALLLGPVTVGANGTAYDVTFYSNTADDLFLWDASEEALTITGTNAQAALTVADGNVAITDDLDVDGTANLDVTDIDGAVDMASTLAVGGNITLENAETIGNGVNGYIALSAPLAGGCVPCNPRAGCCRGS